MAFDSSNQPPDICHVPLYVSLYTTFSYSVMFFFGFLWQFYEKIMEEHTPKGYAPLLDGFNPFYTRHIYTRIAECFNRPIGSLPGAWFDLYERQGSAFDGSLRETGKFQHCLNLGSYNYLGFSDNSSSCIDYDIEALRKYSSSNCSSRLQYGTSDIHRELEKKVAKYLGKDDAIIFGMGYATNSTTIPALIGKGGLILSDSLNHASLVIGCRSSGATIRVFEHNNVKDLERKLKTAIKNGQPDNHNKPWEKILIIIEGLYSMEGDIALLPEIVQLKKKYKAYLYVDEAHSIGAIGRTGRGVCEYCGVNTSDVDVLMGTFTKSFASCGGYIAANQDIINTLRSSSFSPFYDISMSPVCAQQTITILSVLMGEDGTTLGADRIVNLRKNSIYFRKKLKEKGFIVLGNFDSPVIPLIIYSPVVISSFSNKCLERNLAIVVVGYPATDLTLCRARFCMSSAHSMEDLDFALREIDAIGEANLLRFNSVNAPSLEYTEATSAKIN